MNIALNVVLTAIVKYSMIGVVLHLMYTVSPVHVYTYIGLLLVSSSLDLLLSSRVDKLREEYLNATKGMVNGHDKEEAGTPSDRG